MRPLRNPDNASLIPLMVRDRYVHKCRRIVISLINIAPSCHVMPAVSCPARSSRTGPSHCWPAAFCLATSRRARPNQVMSSLPGLALLVCRIKTHRAVPYPAKPGIAQSGFACRIRPRHISPRLNPCCPASRAPRIFTRPSFLQPASHQQSVPVTDRSVVADPAEPTDHTHAGYGQRQPLVCR